MHDNLRISVTDRCNIRCFYCMPETGVKFEPREKILTFEEIERFVRVAVTLGVRKLRITGGEPLVRKDLAKLMRKLVAIEGIEDLALTTNGVLLAEQAAELYDAGTAPHQRSSGYAGSRALQADHAPRRFATSAGGHRRMCRGWATGPSRSTPSP